MTNLETYLAQVKARTTLRTGANTVNVGSMLSDQQKLLKIIEVYQDAIDMYAMTNETFPEYGDVARKAKAKAEQIAGE